MYFANFATTLLTKRIDKCVLLLNTIYTNKELAKASPQRMHGKKASKNSVKHFINTFVQEMNFTKRCMGTIKECGMNASLRGFYTRLIIMYTRLF